jgi:hypothetical protein
MPSRRSKTFDVDKCAIPSVWCGKGDVPKGVKDGVKYTRKGSAEECMKKGFGAGMMTEKAKNLPATSLQTIKYVGETHEQNFRNARIATTTALIKYAKTHTPANVKTMLTRVLKKKGDAGLDGKAYNSVILWLYHKGIKDVPECTVLRQ